MNYLCLEYLEMKQQLSVEEHLPIKAEIALCKERYLNLVTQYKNDEVICKLIIFTTYIFRGGDIARVDFRFEKFR